MARDKGQRLFHFKQQPADRGTELLLHRRYRALEPHEPDAQRVALDRAERAGSLAINLIIRRRIVFGRRGEHSRQLIILDRRADIWLGAHQLLLPAVQCRTTEQYLSA